MKVMKQFLLMLLIVLASLTVKIDVSAEKIWNTTGEKSPWGRGYNYKYWGGNSWSYCGDGSDKYFPDLVDITYNVTYDYEEAYKMLEYVNKARREAGVPELIMKDELMDVAMQRAAECRIYLAHTRPDGTGSETISMYCQGENIHQGYTTAKGATQSLINSPGHYETMISEDYQYAGFGKVGNSWVQIFCFADLYYEDGYDAEFHYENDVYQGGELVYCPLSPNDKPVQWDEMTCGERTNYSEKYTAKVNPALYDRLSIYMGDLYCLGELLEPDVSLVYTYRGNKDWSVIDSSEYDITFSNPNLFELTEDGYRCIKPGTSKVTITMKDMPQFTATSEVSVTVDRGSVLTYKGNQYRVTMNEDKVKEVSLIKASNSKVVSIPKTIKILNQKYKVTSISSKAFMGKSKLQKVVIGQNIRTIGSKTFQGCKNLKTIHVKSSKLQSVGKNALKGIHKRAVIKVPKKQLKQYKKLFKGKGQKKTVKVKK